MGNTFATLARSIPTLERGVPLARSSFIRIGGPAEYFVQTASPDELTRAVRAALDAGVPHRVLGGGANVLIADAGVPGLVIRNIAGGIAFDGTRVAVDSGFNLTRLALLALERGLAGLEFAAGIPGTVGGAVYGNAGAFGRAMQDVVRDARLLRPDGSVETVGAEHLAFAYRHSALQNENAVVLSATLMLEHGDVPAIRAAHRGHLAYRRAHQPLELPSLGSVFRNVPVEHVPGDVRDRLDVRDGQTLVPAGLINDRAGLRGIRRGDAELSPKHGNFIVNRGSARAADVLALIQIIERRVRDQFGITLQKEIQTLGL